MTDKEILELRKVLLVPDTLAECKRLAQLLWTNLIGSPWSSKGLQRLESSYYTCKKENDLITLGINKEGRPLWDSLNFFKKDNTYKEYQVIYLNSNKNMETKNITVTLEQAREWYKSDNETLKTLALNAYSEQELSLNYEDISNNVGLCNIIEFYATRDTEKFRVLHKLSVIAAYFNKGWRRKAGEIGYFIEERIYSTPNGKERKVEVFQHALINHAGIYFRTKEDTEKAIKILGDDIKYLF